MNHPFSLELEFTETYQRHLDDDPAIATQSAFCRNSKYECYGLENQLPGLRTAEKNTKQAWVSEMRSLGCGKARLA
jgi:hypothetical protein